MEFLKPIIGEQLFDELAKKLEGREDVKLANLAEGGYVGKEKFMAAMEKIAALEAELNKSAQAMAAAKAAAQKAVELEGAVQQLNEEKQQMGRQFQQKLIEEKMETAVVGALNAAKVKNMKAVRALIDESRIALTNGALTGLDAQIEALKASDPYLFEIVRDTGGGTNPTTPAATAMAANPDKLDDKTFYNLKFKK